jgi:hypothetical protein
MDLLKCDEVHGKLVTKRVKRDVDGPEHNENELERRLHLEQGDDGVKKVATWNKAQKGEPSIREVLQLERAQNISTCV